MDTEQLSAEQFIEKYRRLCGHIAWIFVRRSKRDNYLDPLTDEDAEDFASCALVSLMKCPVEHRHEKPYVNRLIANAVIKAWRKRLRQMGAEVEATSCNCRNLLGPSSGRGGAEHAENTDRNDIFDRFPGPDGLHGKTQTKFDYAKVIALFPNIPHSERLVLELNFGIGCPAVGLERIAKKLGRSRYWVESRMTRGLVRIREQLTSQEAFPAV